MIPAVIVACSEEPLPEEVEAKIEISTSEITFSEEGGAEVISFTSARDWKAEVDGGQATVVWLKSIQIHDYQ